MTNKEQKINFKQAWQDLEKLTAWFENEELDLDEGIKKLDQGLDLINQCQKMLTQTENKIVEVKAKYEPE